MNGAHYCFSVREDCYNLMDSYGEICVYCNCCGRIDEKTKWQKRLELNERLAKENQEFDGWCDLSEIRELQEKNIAANAVYYQKEIDRCKAVIGKQFE